MDLVRFCLFGMCIASWHVNKYLIDDLAISPAQSSALGAEKSCLCWKYDKDVYMAVFVSSAK